MNSWIINTPETTKLYTWNGWYLNQLDTNHYELANRNYNDNVVLCFISYPTSEQFQKAISDFIAS